MLLYMLGGFACDVKDSDWVFAVCTSTVTPTPSSGITTAGVPQTDIFRPPLWALRAGTCELHGYFRAVSVEKRGRHDFARVSG